MPKPLPPEFPPDFLWGVATSAYQIEGAAAVDGRKPSVWDTFSQKWGRTKDGKTGAVACDHYHRFEEDIQLMVALGVKQYRFSIAWPRVIPDGRGQVNAAGIDFYSRLVDRLLANNIDPVPTLYHWDSPQALEDRYGSWQSREMAQDFADYASVVVSALGDRIDRWITLNEITCFTHLSYDPGQTPEHAPGKRVKTKQEVWQTVHHALLAHGLGVQAIRAASPKPCKVGLVDNFGVTVPLTETPEDIAAAQAAFPYHCGNGGIIYPAIAGRYHPGLLTELGANAPAIAQGDEAIIHQPLDFLGLNIYTGCYIRAADNDKGCDWLRFPPGYPRLDMPWLHLVPESLYWGIRHVSETLGRPDLPLFITENGCAAQDERTPQGEIIDSDRILYLRQYLQGVARAAREGYPISGYYLWSLLDNFEWSWGYSKRFGIIFVDYKTQARIQKASYHWYAACIKAGRVL
ncbi:MAG: beta-glucosidase [Alkalinema sp. RU_4_3]|nr:beta-glucosidase [Alkalinema sp. RU_4_3]